MDFVTSLRQTLNIILYSNVSFASIQEKVRHSGGINGNVLVGDFNARFGVTVKDIPCLAEVANNTLYEIPSLPDSIHQSNENVGELKQDENLVKPSDDEFKAYIESTQNIQAVYTCV